MVRNNHPGEAEQCVVSPDSSSHWFGARPQVFL